MRFACCALLATTACALQYGESDPGPPTGTPRHYIVDAIYLPSTNSEARQMSDDLNGDRTPDNQLGMVISTLKTMGDVTTHGPDMVASGAIASSLELVADDVANDETVSVIYHGAEGDDAVGVTGALTDGWFRSERTRSENAKLGRAVVKLPVYVDADPVSLTIEDLEIDLQPDGLGGFDAYLRGGVPAAAANHAAYLGAQQMLDADPLDHLSFMALMDATQPRDWYISETEWQQNSIVHSFFESDITVRGERLLSIGFRAHVSPCDGNCSPPAPVDRCHDRVRDQDEVGTDCGGSCGACPTGQPCGANGDCLSNHCSAGMCQSPSCIDGVRDGFEADIDCGAACGPCAVGQACYDNTDCPPTSFCGEPCTSTICPPHFDTCQ